MTHTKTPWNLNTSGPRPTIYQAGGKSNTIAAFYNQGGNKEENAKFVLLACNAYDDMVAALVAVDKYLTELQESGYGSHPYNPVGEKVISALSKAKWGQ